jgi:hypothetical protein
VCDSKVIIRDRQNFFELYRHWEPVTIRLVAFSQLADRLDLWFGGMFST